MPGSDLPDLSLIDQIVNQLVSPPLRGEKILGLPRSWFEAAALKNSAQPDPVVPADAGPLNAGLTAAAGLRPAAAGSYDDLDLAGLKAEALVCTKCRLCETRNKVVFGVGNTESPLIAFVGEGPGADEDRLGEPFVGRAGDLLTAAITKGLGLERKDVYIANVVKCRPPQNRAPLPDEVEACTKYLYRQLELIKPKVIVTLGQPAQMALSGVNLGITRLRGQWQNWRGIKLMPTFHPAYLLRNPAAKKEFWADLKSVMAELGLEVRGQGRKEGD